jgi:fluoride exporter
VVITALLVLVCGGAGAVARFLVDGIVQSRRATDFPLGTLVVNLSGAFLLGLLAGLAPPSRLMLVLGTATIGSYTTFSTWMLEVHRPAEDGDRGLALWNLAVMVAGGIVAVVLGRALGRAL